MKLRVPRPRTLVLLTVALVVIGIGLRIGMPIYRQRAAVKEIKRIGGEIQVRNGAPNWLLKSVSHKNTKFLNEIVHVRFRPDEPTFRARYSYFLYASNNQELWTDGSAVDDSTLACVGGLDSLESLDVCWTSIGDAGIRSVQELRNLIHLELSGSDVTDASLPILKRFTKLQKISLHSTKVTDAGVAELRRAIPGLRIVR